MKELVEDEWTVFRVETLSLYVHPRYLKGTIRPTRAASEFEERDQLGMLERISHALEERGLWSESLNTTPNVPAFKEAALEYDQPETVLLTKPFDKLDLELGKLPDSMSVFAQQHDPAVAQGAPQRFEMQTKTVRFE
jgi:hypothetical protein